MRIEWMDLYLDFACFVYVLLVHDYDYFMGNIGIYVNCMSLYTNYFKIHMLIKNKEKYRK